MKGAAVGQLVDVDAGNDRVADCQPPNRFADVARFVGVQARRFAFWHRAESAMPSADVAEDHEGCGALTPAFEDVRAARLLTDGMQAQVGDHAAHALEAFCCVKPDLEPLGPWSG